MERLFVLAAIDLAVLALGCAKADADTASGFRHGFSGPNGAFIPSLPINGPSIDNSRGAARQDTG